MKSFKLVVTLVLMAGFLTASGFAKNSKLGKTAVIGKPVTTVTMPTVNPQTSGLPDNRPTRSGQRAPMNAAAAAPAPTKLSKEAFTKQYGTMSSGLSGLYHIPGNFPSIGAAVAVLNYLGLSGNATFELDATAYTENSPIVFGAYTGSGTYTATFQPGPGVATTVTFVSTYASGKGFAFNGAQNVTIDGLNTGGASLAMNWAPNATSTYPDGDIFGSTVYITGMSQSIAVKNASVKGHVNNDVWINQTQGRPALFIFTATADPGPSAAITFDHLTITGATYGIKVLSQSAIVSVDSLNITNCNIGSAFGDSVAEGGWYEYTEKVTFANNVVDGIHFLDYYWNNAYDEYDNDVVFGAGQIMYGFAYTTAEYFALTDRMRFHDNIIRNVDEIASPGEGLSTYAVRIYDSNQGLGVASETYNNRIYNISNPGGGGSLLVGFRGPQGNFYNNSIQLAGVFPTGVTATCFNGGAGVTSNNAFSMELTGGGASSKRAAAAGGTINHNALYSTGYFVASYSTPNAAVAAGINPNGSFGPVGFTSDLHLNSAGPSAAENIGMQLPFAERTNIVHDIDGDLRDTSVTGHPDAGADEVAAPFTAPFASDVWPVSVPTPLPAGVPASLGVTPVVWVKNNTIAPTAGFNLQLNIADAGPYSSTIAVPPLSPLADTAISTFTPWTPAAGGPWTVTATSSLAGDIYPGYSIITRTQTAQAPLAISNDTTWTWDAGAGGWTSTNDWVLSNTFTKLGGPYEGKSWVTNRPNDSTTYTEGAYASSQGYSATYPGANVLTSPWLNLSGLPGGDLYISFVQSINTEPGWDGSWWDYTTDGVTWHKLGQLNDPNGINWYSTSVYANAQSYIGNPPDTATMQMPNYLIYGPGTDNPTLPMAFWTSNGNPGVVGSETGPMGPDGWIYNQLHVTSVTNAALYRAPVVKFRYVAFSDASGAYAGWAIDNFRLSHTSTVFTGGTITGTVFEDLNANGVADALEPLQSGMKVYLAYFGVAKETTTTDVNGLYSFNIGSANNSLPGAYDVTVANNAGWGYVLPTYPNVGVVNHPSDGSVLTQNFALFNGHISGTVFSDVNDNRVFDNGEPGIAGYTVDVHKDSLNGAIVASGVTAANGTYVLGVPPNTYWVVEESLATARRTFPLPGPYDAVTTSGTSGSPTAVSAGNNFGNWLFGQIYVSSTKDFNADGIEEASDAVAIDAPAIAVYNVTKSGVHFLGPDTVGGGAQLTDHFTMANLDSGVYTVTQSYLTPTWAPTTPTSYTVSLTSGASIVDTFLSSRLLSYSGTIYNDVNGNGVKNPGENGVLGWTVTLNGIHHNGIHSTLSDSLGNYSFTGLLADKFNVTETVNAGWTRTTAAAYNDSLHLASPIATGRNFGNFKQFSISGIAYRDRNLNGVRDAGEEGLVRTFVVSGASADTTTSAGDGSFTLSGKGPGSFKLMENPVPAGFAISAPAGDSLIVVGVSGTNVTGEMFGNVQISDSQTTFRTFSATDFFNAYGQKVIKRVKKAPIIAPNLYTLMAELDVETNKLPGYGFGLAGIAVPTPGKGNEPYLLPSKYGDVFTTIYAKAPGTAHTGTPHGLDYFDGRVKLIIGWQKTLTALLQNNKIVADLLALSVNIAFSDHGRTTPGFGDLIYNDPGNPLNAKTIRQIKASADTIMTLWYNLPLSVYMNYDTVVAKINAAFTNGDVVFGASDTATWQSSTKLTLKGVKPVTSVAFLSANPQVTPKVIPDPIVEYVAPTAYALLQNYPNPFNPTTSIPFDLPQQSVVTLKIYNMLGQEIATLIDHQTMDADRQEVTFDASRLPSGVYFYRIMANGISDGTSAAKNFTQVKKMMLLK